MPNGIFEFLDHAILSFTSLFPADSFWALPFQIKGLLATLLVCFICGAMGALVVGNRMAFFSDSLAHCAFAGIGLGLLICLLAQVPNAVLQQRITLIMVAFGMTVGLLIAYVRDQTGLASDTVIGVFYAGAIGFGAIFMHIIAKQNRQSFDLEQFIFGNPFLVDSWQIVALAALALGIGAVLFWSYNGMVLASASPSLALSRRVPVRFYQYLLIVLLALLVNLSLQIVGTLLINGLLIVPAAAAANIARNLRQMFWYSIAIALAACWSGFYVSWEVGNRFKQVQVGISGAIIVLCVLAFAVCAVVGGLHRRARPVPAAAG